MGTQSEWSQLPDHVIVEILLHLKLSDRYHASVVCKSWNQCFHLHYLWREFKFMFNQDHHCKYLNVFTRFGQFIQNVEIYVDQSQDESRKNACKVLKELSVLPERRLCSLKIRFIGENPIFYSGKEFIDVLMPLFAAPAEDKVLVHQLEHIDLSGLTVTIDDTLINKLSGNHPMLKTLNIINKVLICKVSPTALLRLVTRCRKLGKLCTFYSSMSDDILLALTEVDRDPLQTIVLKCRREEKYGKDFDGDLWESLCKKLPALRVTLIFDYSCPLHRVSEIMKYQVPVSILRLETFTYIYDELKQATKFYNDTLTKVVLNTPMSKNCPELNEALVELAESCHKLTSLHVFCVLDQFTVDRILDIHPQIRDRGSYTLKYKDEPAPWAPGKDCGEDE